MDSFVLLVTWIVSGQPSSSYQTTFKSAEACEVAKASLVADAQRVKAEFEKRTADAARATTMPPPVPAQIGVVTQDQLKHLRFLSPPELEALYRRNEALKETYRPVYTETSNGKAWVIPATGQRGFIADVQSANRPPAVSAVCVLQ